ncbi:MAG TPA: hypothetical protein VHU19_14420 [Pyrinomonadaceae bacterium]|jgi:hypothetical protein|nr:hypothetical protein [Pyrinomonadaceae bacterium]
MIAHRNEMPALQPAVNFYSIETNSPARAFWVSLAHLLFRLGAAARRKGEVR